jgi:hypothetical protein
VIYNDDINAVSVHYYCHALKTYTGKAAWFPVFITSTLGTEELSPQAPFALSPEKDHLIPFR